MNNTLRDPDRDELHERNLDYTIKELQRRVKEHEQQLSRLRASSKGSSSTATTPVATLQVMKTAFDDLSTADSYLPFPESVLPSLLALRKTHAAAAASGAYLVGSAPTLADARRRLEASRAALEDQKALSSAMTKRLDSLSSLRRQEAAAGRGVSSSSGGDYSYSDDDDADAMEQDADELAQKRIDELAARARRHDQDRHALLRSLRAFVDGPLAPLLAAEQLGGPVVGDAMDVDGGDLRAGFTAQGKARKSRGPPPGGGTGSGGGAEDDKRQRRLDEIWGNVRDGDGAGGERRAAASSSSSNSQKEWNEAAAAAKEMKDLVMLLLNQLIKAKGDSAASYVEVARESAAARFLVRSKVAVLHPRDATRIRLVDFGKEIDA